MDRRELITGVIRQCGLSIEVDEAERIFESIVTPWNQLDTGQKNAMLLIMERYVLNEQHGHRLSIRLGQSDAVNNPDCLVCRRPVEATDWSVRIYSVWESALIWLTWHDYCLENAEVGQDFDLLTGLAATPLGFT